jgi:hypothetical protein
MKKVTKKVTKSVSKSKKVVKPVAAVGNKESAMKIADCNKLASLCYSKLPNFKITGHIRDLVNIKEDKSSHGKAVIIWYGAKSIAENDRVELRVTRNLSVICLSMCCPNAKELEDEVSKLLHARKNKNRVTVTLQMGSYRPDLIECLELPEIEVEQVKEVVAAEPVAVPAEDPTSIKAMLAKANG